MVFSSLPFLCFFFPVVFLLYYSWNNRSWRNGLLIAASLVFYAYGEPVYILLMLLSITLNYGLALASEHGRKAARWLLALAVACNLGLLIVFKYADMLIAWCNQLFGTSFLLPNIALPIGISFFTFQALSYVIDVYRKETPAQHNFFLLTLYISFFPQLIAGPIVKYHDIANEIASRHTDVNDLAEGLYRFIIGLAKKVLIANTMARCADSLFAMEMADQNILSSWLLAISYSLQIFFDFAGYSDMAIGLGRIFGFHFKENFNYPYISCSIQKFWRRWHISLSTWFKEYLYIPLGGNRKGKVRTCLNKLIVFIATGLWHGANLTFLFWGLWHGFFILLEQWVDFGKIPRLLRWAGTMLVVVIGFTVFRADTLSQGLQLVTLLFTGFRFTALGLSLVRLAITPVFIIGLLLALVFSTPIAKWLHEKEPGWLLPLNYAGTLLLLGLVVLNLAGGGYNPFIYFRF